MLCYEVKVLLVWHVIELSCDLLIVLLSYIDSFCGRGRLSVIWAMIIFALKKKSALMSLTFSDGQSHLTHAEFTNILTFVVSFDSLYADNLSRMSRFIVIYIY